MKKEAIKLLLCGILGFAFSLIPVLLWILGWENKSKPAVIVIFIIMFLYFITMGIGGIIQFKEKIRINKGENEK